MQIIKIKYQVNDEDKRLIKKYMQQYTSVNHYAYNRKQDGLTMKQIEKQIKNKNYIINIIISNLYYITVSNF